jgi:hypothetical protein
MPTPGATVWQSAWRFWRRPAPPASPPECVHLRRRWLRLRSRDPGVLLDGSRYCPDVCLDRALLRMFDRILPANIPSANILPINQRNAVSHRVPLGLVLLSRQDLTAEQLRIALAAQHAAERGKIGEWVQTLGFATEAQVTAALARQWSCPVLRPDSVLPLPDAQASRHIPLALLEKIVMLPINFAASVLYIAFAEGVDHTALYAVEQMIGCRTQPCMADPSFVRAQLHALAGKDGKRDFVFDRVADRNELSRIIRSYCLRVQAVEVRLAACPPYLWARLLCPANTFLDLLLGMPVPRHRTSIASRVESGPSPDLR